mmetsp:Transcript_60391/g.168742  ORF Transcript_60391/g.168742 Transcript_60391/m.168742 type:complete len:229 (+) Transcript_60391:87-773(+)
MKTICVHVSGLSGLVCEVQVRPDCTVMDIKQHVQNHAGISVFEQRLLFGHALPADDNICLRLLAEGCPTGGGSLERQILRVTLVRRPPEQAKFLARIDKNPLETHNYLAQASPELKADKEIVLAAVRLNGHALMDAAEALKGDGDVVLAACAQNAHALRYASAALRADRELLLRAASKNCHALKFADETLKADKDFMLALVREHGAAFMYAAPELKEDEELLRVAGAR